MKFRWGLLSAAILAALARPAVAETQVDLALVLAVDVSLSMDEDEEKLQRRGYAAALADPRVQDAIRSGPNHRIAVTYLEWSSPTDQRVIVGWRMISDDASAKAFADELLKARIKPGTTTSISGGIDYAVQLFRSLEFKAVRRIIDISGDGYSDYGRPIRLSRDEAVASGVTINGLPVMNKRPAWREPAPPDLDQYYAQNVIGGPGSFYLVVKDLEDFSNAVLRKLILEIAGHRSPSVGPG
jgi:hypothetical protein